MYFDRILFLTLYIVVHLFNLSSSILSLTVHNLCAIFSSNASLDGLHGQQLLKYIPPSSAISGDAAQ